MTPPHVPIMTAESEVMTLGIMKRREAFEAKLTRFFTGRACKNGHISERYVSTGSCIQCLKKKWVHPPGDANYMTHSFGMLLPRSLTETQLAQLNDHLAGCAWVWISTHAPEAKATAEKYTYAIR